MTKVGAGTDMTGFGGLVRSKSRAARSLSPAARTLHCEILLALASTGRPPSPIDIDEQIRECGQDPADVRAELSRLDVIAWDETGAVRAAYPFSPTATAHRVSWPDGPEVFAMCAIDALGVSAMLDRPVTIESLEPGSGAVVTVHVDGDSAEWAPAGAVVFTGTDGAGCCPAVDETCGYINFFTTRAAAQSWARTQPHVSGSIYKLHGALAMAVAEFGELLRPTGNPT